MDHEQKIEATTARVAASTAHVEASTEQRRGQRRPAHGSGRQPHTLCSRAHLCGLGAYRAGRLGQRRRCQGHAEGRGSRVGGGLGRAPLLILFSAFCFGAAVWREIDTDASPPQPGVRRMPRGLLIAVNCFLGAVSLTALVGVWFGNTGGR